ncbi:TPA: translation initiation factor IF-3 [Clostridioides difficile]|nr:translation initiation factor IF-3 [Clostridioides difficile]HDX7008507.1 translation initiation factor IF-3 [Clostridioides difficile]HDX7037165.1 translation initiation factor IF-3 [Clostridioides difficile]HDX7041036.1 translation initiation factor IF-3 [Clostridioides difficile]HDX7228556.1 translation initiation factor IF-3 [Clostridioides difficile]
MSKELAINEQIKDKEIRVLSPTGEQLGVMPTKEAQAMANSKNLDLVQISPNANPPVCKIMDYGKFRYEQARKEKEAKKKQKTIVVKEVRLRPGIEQNDLNTKANNAIKFLKKGDKVKVELRFRGRELGHKDIGKEVMLKFLDIIKEFGEPTKAPAFEGNNMVVIIDPKKIDD